MKSFVTGATGFLGSHLVDRLLSQGDDVHVLVRRSSNLRWLLGKKITLHYGDVADASAHSLKGLREGLDGADVVYHVAGLIKTARVSQFYEVNVQGTIHVLDACLETNPNVKRVVIVTSLAARGPGRPGDDQPARETDAYHPTTDYGRSKRDAEIAALGYKDKLPIAIVRPPAIYGPRDDQILHFFRLVQKGLAVLPGGGSHFINLSHVQDIVTGLVLAGTHPQAVGEIFFIGENQNYEWSEMVHIIARALGKKPLLLKLPPWVFLGAGYAAEVLGKIAGRSFTFNLAQAQNFIQRNWTMDVSKAGQVLGYQSSYSLTRGAAETALWYRDEEWL
jgi:dihydroflavonol-4-reductase